jgi:hypothetical protein
MTIHHNFTTHRDSWRKAIEKCIANAPGPTGDGDERAYWRHELKAFDEAFATIKNCRDDGRCQYAIDHGAEGLGYCPTGKCVMPDAEGGDVIDLAQKRTPRQWAAPFTLTFDDLRAANIARLPLFRNCHGEVAHSMPDGSDWSPAEWLEAVTGELGEYANFHKKFRRGDITCDEFMIHASKELADVQTYLDILARRCLDLPGKPHATGIDLGWATVEKFNEVSKRVGCDVFLPIAADRQPEPVVQPKISDDQALIMEAYDMGQFASDTLGIGGSNRGLAEPVRAALCRLLDKHYQELYGPNAEKSETGYSANTMYIVATDSNGQRAVTSSRSTFTPQLDYSIMEAALDFEQAKRLRNVEIQPHKVGELWMTTIKPLTAPDHTALLADSTTKAARIINDAELLAKLRQICGYVENGSDESVTIVQDDATREWALYVGTNSAILKTKRRAYSASSFHQVIAVAAEKEGDRS